MVNLDPVEDSMEFFPEAVSRDVQDMDNLCQNPYAIDTANMLHALHSLMNEEE